MDKDINVAYVEIRGRYPDKGRVTNEVCKEMAYITEGKGKIVVEGEEIELNELDLILLEPGERYYWEGNLKMVVPCTPAWYPEQHKEVE
jgi:mannose-6-phosphate isomerase-like protein (cupin superfamily)